MSSPIPLQYSGAAAQDYSPRGRTTQHASLLIMSIPWRLMDLRLVFVLCLMLVLHSERIYVSSLPLYHSRHSEEKQASLQHDNEHSHLTQKDLPRTPVLHRNGWGDGVEEDQVRSKRAIVSPSFLVDYWDDGIVPFTFEGELRDERMIQNKVLKAMDIWHRKTCIRFVPKKSSDKNFVSIHISQQVCSASVGKRLVAINGRQSMLLTRDCAKHRGRILHELGHVIGFFHEHQRPDRDQYIRVNMSNIKPGLRNQFAIRNDSMNLGYEYDLRSIMHYDALSTAIDPSRPAFTLLDKSVDINEVGQRRVLSKSDKEQARLLYQCDSRDYVQEAILRRSEVITTSNFIEHDNQLSFQPILNDNQCQWMNCSSHSCGLTDCPGKFIRPNDRAKCPQVLFRIHKIPNPNSTISSDSPYIAVGDYVSLHKNMTVEAFSCSEKPGNCSFNPKHCIDHSGEFNSKECWEQVLVVKSMKKKLGERVQHKDEIWFKFLKTPSKLPGEMSWLTCESGIESGSNNSSCYRVIGQMNSNNREEQDISGASGDSLLHAPPTLLSVYKF